MASLHLRILLAASVVLVAFFGLTGVILDNAYRHSAEEALHERLQGYAYALVAVMEPNARGAVQLNNALPIPRFFTPGSGLYGRVMRNDGHTAWRSPSMEGLNIPFPRGVARGERRSALVEVSGTLLSTFNIGVSWDDQVPLGQSIHSALLKISISSRPGSVPSARPCGVPSLSWLPCY